MMRSNHEQEDEDQQSRLIFELSSLLFTILRTSSPSSPNPRSRSRVTHVTPGAFASLLLGASLALMLCGSVTFVLGFILMPWIVGFVVILYFVGVVSQISARLERTVVWCSGGPTSPKELQGEFFSKLSID